MAEEWIAEERLRITLESHVAIEQATGALAQRETISVDEALLWLRGQAHGAQRTLAEVAHAVLDEAQPGT